MFYVYLLKSRKDNNFYIGSTIDLKKRFIMHNDGKVPSTKDRKPFELIYYEAYSTEVLARHREHNLKLRSNAYNQLKKESFLPISVGASKTNCPYCSNGSGEVIQNYKPTMSL